jgi:outer membrane murein-binding lipoprotein Lpp
MKKLLILPVLFSVLFLGGCSGYYSQDQVSQLIQQQTAANQAEISVLSQQVSNLQNTINNLAQKVSPIASTSVPVVVNNQSSVAAMASSTASANVVNNISTKGWLTFNNKALLYQFKYPANFFNSVGSFEVSDVDCSVANFNTECVPGRIVNGGPALYTERREINGHQFCVKSHDEGAAGTFYFTYEYIDYDNINAAGDKCGDLKLTLAKTDCGVLDGDAVAFEKCQKTNDVVDPQTLSKVESTFTFPQ